MRDLSESFIEQTRGIELSNTPLCNEYAEKARLAAIRGLDFIVRHQQTDPLCANFGRFPAEYICTDNSYTHFTGNWMTAIAVEALLAGYQFTANEEYRQAAGYGVVYLKSLQEFAPMYGRLCGVFREDTPQTPYAYPRDATTAAWALMDWSDVTEEADAFERAVAYADWFVNVGLEPGYPYWHVRFDNQPWDPTWHGSFHSGSAFFLARMYEHTGQEKYRDGMRTILGHYNAYHLSEDGLITVIIDRAGMKPLDGVADLKHSNREWEIMHRYNDDFGALANLIAWQLEEEQVYLSAAKRFLLRMVESQRQDGGFGPAKASVPSAGGTVLLELLAARACGYEWASTQTYERVVDHLLSLQIDSKDSPADGAFCELDADGNIQQSLLMRTHAYAIMALLKAAGAIDPVYFPTTN